MTEHEDETVDLAPVEAESLPDPGDLPGVIPEFADLKPDTIITEGGMARIFRRDRSTVKKMVLRGELPPPCRMAGSNIWTIGAIVRHIEARLEEAGKDMRRIAKHTPAKHSS